MSSAPAPLTPGGSAAALPPAVPPVPTSGSSAGPIPASGTSASVRVSNATVSTFAIPNGISLTQFDGLDWANWSNTLEAVLCLHEADDIVRNAAPPAGVDVGEWNTIHRRGLAYLRLFIKPDIYSLIASSVDYPTFFDKWQVLSNTYGGASGSTTIFNLWISITQARLDDSAPMAPQLAKLIETRVALFNASMGITDTQYCLILLNALPASYEVLASTILAVTVLTVTPTRKVDPGLQDLQTRARRILAERNAKKAEENTWIGRMAAAENINDMKALIKSRDSV